MFSTLSEESIDKEQKRHDKATEDMQQAQIEWTKKRQERLNYINNEIMKEHKAEKRFTDINAAMQQYFLVGSWSHYHLNQSFFSPIFMYHLKITIIVNLHL